MENNEIYKVRFKNCTCYYFDDIIKFEHFLFYNILIYEESWENILIQNISYRNLKGPKSLGIEFDKID